MQALVGQVTKDQVDDAPRVVGLFAVVHGTEQTPAGSHPASQVETAVPRSRGCGDDLVLADSGLFSDAAASTQNDRPSLIRKFPEICLYLFPAVANFANYRV